MMVIGWRAWVDEADGVAVYDSRKNQWSDIPADGVIYIMLYKSDGDIEPHLMVDRKESLAGNDYYWRAPHHSGHAVYGSSNESPELIAERYPGADIKRGKWVPAPVYRECMIAASVYVFEVE